MGFNTVTRAPDLVPVRSVVISCSDKRGLDGLAAGLLAANPECTFYATGGSFATLSGILGPAARERLVAVSDYTGQPEMDGGLVKTLDWKIYLGILAESGNERHQSDLERCGAVAFDMVVANLYPFDQASADPSSRPEELRQRIDIGGPALLRAAAKNFLRVASVSEPGQYPALLAEIRTRGGTSLETRRRLAVETFALTSRFDAAVSARLGGLPNEELTRAYLAPSAAGSRA